MRRLLDKVKVGIPAACLLLFIGCGKAYPEFEDALLFDQLLNSSTTLVGDGIAPTVSGTVPANAATGIAVNSSLSITFSEAMDTASITTNTGSTACSGSIQVSADDFSTCISMNGAPAAAGGNTNFTIVPAANLAATTLHKIRVTTAAKDASGVALATTFTTTTGFTTGAGGGDTTPPTVNSTTPANTNKDIAFNSTIAVTFSEAMSVATITTNTANTTCSGSIQVSSDSFTTCVQMAAGPVASGGNTIFTLTPNANLNPGATYQVRVTTTVTDAAANALAVQFTTATGFTTRYVVFVTSGTSVGNMLGVTGIAGADAMCMGDTNKPTTGTYKAMIVDGAANRVACSTNPNCGAGEGTDWVFQASTSYYRVDGTTIIFTTNAGGIFNFTGVLTNSFGTGGTTYWTGLMNDWRTDTRHCSNWTSNTSGGGAVNQGERGSDTGSGSTSISAGGGSPNCNTMRTLVCVQQ